MRRPCDHLLERAQRALAIALNGGAATAERHSAYRVVERLMAELGTPVPEQANTTIRAQIEPATVPVGELTSSLIVRTPEVILNGLPKAGPTRRTYVESRVTRAGESEIHALTDLTRRCADTATLDGSVRQASQRLRESLNEQKTMLVGLITCAEPDVAEAARIRLADVNDALDITRNLVGEPA